MFISCVVNLLLQSLTLLLVMLQIIWPTDLIDSLEVPTILFSIDGTHCQIQEPKHETHTRDPAYYSHKFKRAAYNYKLVISVHTNQLVWMNGPFPAGKNDLSVFQTKGLRNKMKANLRLVADGGYTGEAHLLTPNQYDNQALKGFKSRARARHETFNSRIKVFKALAVPFRHKLDRHKCTFEAVCVLVQYQLENGSPLFDI